MSFKKRRLLFITSLILFIIIAPLVTLYSQGYKFDFQNKKFVQTGGIFVKIYPTECQLYINNKLKKKTDLLTGTAFVNNLLPKKYHIEIKKEGYFPWIKNLDVKEKKVTDAKNIYLVPRKINFTSLKTDIGTSTKLKVKNLLLSPNKSKILFSQFSQDNQKVNVINLDNNKISLVWENTNKSNGTSRLKNIYWSPDSQRIALELQNNKRNTYLIINQNNKETKISTDTDYIFPLLGIPQNNKLISDIKSSICYKVLPHSILFLSKEGFLIKSNFDGLISQIYNLNPIKIDKNKSYKIVSQGDKNILLKEDNKLYYLDPQIHLFKEISHSVNSVSFSPDSNKLAFSNGHDIWVFYLKPEYSQPRRKAQESVFLTRFSENVSNLNWLNSNYLIFSLGNEIKISEIDNRDRLNMENIATFPSPKLIFNQRDKKLYVLSQGKLYVSQPLIK